MTFLRRDQWGAQIYDVALKKRIDPVIGITYHYSTGQELGRNDCAAWVRQIQKYHMNTKGYSDVAYNVFVCRHGDIFEGRPTWAVGAHAATKDNLANRMSWSICFLGNDDAGTDVPAVAWTAMLAWHKARQEEVGHGLFNFGHRDWQSFGGTVTQCPGDEIMNGLTYFRALAKG
jgi:hypothetical protein